MSKSRMLGVSAAIILLFSLSNQAFANQPGVHFPWMEEFKKRVERNWTPVTYPVTDPAWITAYLAKNGKLYDLQIANRGSEQAKADLLQAVLGSTAYAPLEFTIENIDFNFYLHSEPPGHTSNGIKEYFTAHPEQEDKFIGFYRIPLDVLQRYPGLFEENELLSMKNVSVLESNKTAGNGLPLSLEKIRFIYSDCWIPFFVEHPTASKQEILKFASQIRCMFGLTPEN